MLRWIGFCNEERLHEELGDLPPTEYEELNIKTDNILMLPDKASLQETQGASGGGSAPRLHPQERRRIVALYKGKRRWLQCCVSTAC